MRIRTTAAAWVAALALGGAVASSGCGSGGGVHIQSASPDATVTARVKTALLNDTQINATKIDVTTSGGVVTLAGSVRSQADADRAVQLTRGTNGVKDVKSELHVGG